MGHLPNLWSDSYRFNEERSYFLLEAEADGYAREDIRICGTDDADFTLVGYDIVIRGTVIDNQGQPLTYREVDIEVDDDQEEDVEERNFNVEQAVIDEQGRFELYVPRVKGLMLTLELNNPYMWRNKLSDRGIEKDERDPAFVYYLDMEVPIRFEPDKNEYWVEIVPQRPDITITVEVTDADGIPLPGIPVVPYTRRREIPQEWSLFRLIGITDQNGMCIITGVPRVEKLLLEFCQIPEPFIPFGHNDRPLEYFKKFLTEEYITALSKSQQDFVPASQEVTLEEGKRDHTVRIVLSSKP